MGIVIGQGPLYPERTIGTPEGDTAERGMRIQDYMNKIKSEAVVASLWSGREARIAARLAGQEPPPIDQHAGTRAQVPPEMFPPVLIVGNDDPLDDWNGNAIGYIVSQRFRDAVEVLDPGTHQFVPVELRRHDGQLYEGRPFYYMRVTRLINAINLAQSPKLRQVGSLVTPTETTMFHIDRGQSFAVYADRIAGMGLWRDIRSPEDIFASERLVTLLRERAPTGWASQETFTEL